MTKHFLDLTHEEFWILCLNAKTEVVSTHKLSVGGYDSTPVCIRKIMTYVLESNASSIIMIHNHPSGVLKPSEADKAVTVRIAIGLGIFQVTLADHLIMTDQSYFSFRDHGLLE